MALKTAQLEKFDPANPAHRAVYSTFLKEGKLTQKFELEVPYTNMTDMIVRKLAAWAVEPRVSSSDIVTAILA
jgi:hypothetical protein